MIVVTPKSDAQLLIGLLAAVVVCGLSAIIIALFACNAKRLVIHRIATKFVSSTCYLLIYTQNEEKCQMHNIMSTITFN